MTQLTESEAEELEHALVEAASSLDQIHPTRGHVLNALETLRYARVRGDEAPT